MAAAKFTAPNWAQKVIIQAAGVNPRDVTVSGDCDTYISFTEHRQRHLPRRDYIVDKITGKVLMSEDNGTANCQVVREGEKIW